MVSNAIVNEVQVTLSLNAKLLIKDSSAFKCYYFALKETHKKRDREEEDGEKSRYPIAQASKS